jgi:probable phosphoglycerate mutase
MAPKMVYLCRHGETEWTLSGQHTSSTDLELTENGKEEAKILGKAPKVCWRLNPHSTNDP